MEIGDHLQERSARWREVTRSLATIKPDHERQFRPATRTAAVGLAQGAGLLLRMSAFVLIANAIGPEGVGYVAAVLAVGAILELPSGLGLKNAAIYFLPGYHAIGEDARKSGFVRSASAISAQISLAMLALVVLAATAVGFMGLPGGSFIVLAVLVGASHAQLNLHVEVLKALDLPLAGTVIGSAARHLVLLLMLVGVALSAADPVWYVATFVATAALTAALLRSLVLRECGSKPDLRDRSRWLGYSLPQTLSGASLLMMSQVPVLVVSWIAGTVASGGYAVAYRLAAMPLLITAAINTARAPRIVHHLRAARFGDALAEYRQLLRLNLGLVALCSTIAVAAGGFLLDLHGPEFAQFRPELVVLVMGLAVSASVGPVAFLLTALGEGATVVRSYVFVGTLTIILMVPAVHLWGSLAAASLVSVAMIVQTVWQSTVLRRLWPYPLVSEPLVEHGA